MCGNRKLSGRIPASELVTKGCRARGSLWSAVQYRMASVISQKTRSASRKGSVCLMMVDLSAHARGDALPFEDSRMLGSPDSACLAR